MDKVFFLSRNLFYSMGLMKHYILFIWKASTSTFKKHDKYKAKTFIVFLQWFLEFLFLPQKTKLFANQIPKSSKNSIVN